MTSRVIDDIQLAVLAAMQTRSPQDPAALTGNETPQEGVVSQWNERGFGFIHFTDGRRAYVHHSECGGQHLTEGEVVTAVVVQDAQNPGKYAARQVSRRPEYATDHFTELPTQQVKLEVASREPIAPAVEGVRETGIVMQWNERGYGFIHFTDGKRAYVHNSACGGAHLKEGEIVSAVLVPDSQNPGKWAACSVERGAAVEDSQLSAPLAEPEVLPVLAASPSVTETGERLEGVVTQWSERGFGFIQFSDSRRAYVHTSFCGGQHLKEGETVSAELVADSQNPGKWAAHNVKLGPLGEDGVVTEWREDGGYGFMAIDDGRRAYIHRSAIGGSGSLVVGMRLRVDLKPDPRNPGKWCVAQVRSQLTNEPSESELTELSQERLLQQQQQQQQQLDQLQQQLHEQQHQPAVLQDTEDGANGTVTEWHDDSGYGFLTLDDGRRAYVHRSVFGGTGTLPLGMRLHVIVRADTRNPGKLCIGEIKHELPVVETSPTISTSTVTVQDAPTSDMQTGVVSEWREEGGFGFMTMEDGRRAYIHRSVLGGSVSLVVGQVLQVSMRPDPRNPGKWSVGEVLSDTGLQPAALEIMQPVTEPSAEDGVVSEWREEGGYGFIMVEDGRRAYIHRSALPATHQSLIVGQSLRAVLKPDLRNPGKWCVGEAVVGTDAILGTPETEPSLKRQRVA